MRKSQEFSTTLRCQVGKTDYTAIYHDGIEKGKHVVGEENTYILAILNMRIILTFKL